MHCIAGRIFEVVLCLKWKYWLRLRLRLRLNDGKSHHAMESFFNDIADSSSSRFFQPHIQHLQASSNRDSYLPIHPSRQQNHTAI